MKLIYAPLALALVTTGLIGCQPAPTSPATNETNTETAPAATSPVPVSIPAEMSAETTTDTAATADTCGQLIGFAAGSDTTTASGQVAGYDSCSFRLQAQKGQRIEVALEGSTYLVALLFPPATDGTAIAGPLDKLDATLPVTG